MRFKERAKVVVVFVGNRVKLVIVAASALHGQAKERLTGVFDCIKHPDVAVELVPVPTKVTGGTENTRIGRSQLIPCQHLHDHPVIRLVFVQ